MIEFLFSPYTLLFAALLLIVAIKYGEAITNGMGSWRTQSELVQPDEGGAGANAPAQEAPPTWRKRTTKWWSENWVAGLVVVAVIGYLLWLALLWRGSGTSLSNIGYWAWSHWVEILVTGIVIVIFVDLNAKNKKLEKAASTIRWTFAGGAILIFFGLPLFFGLQQLRLPQPKCQDGTWRETRCCLVNPKWSHEFINDQADGDENQGADLCHSPSRLVESTRELREGVSFFSFRSTTGGEVNLCYRFIRGGCPENLPI